jgi:hypothetical protein
MKIHLHAFLTSALDGAEWSVSFTDEVRAPGTRRIRGWVGAGAYPDAGTKKKFLIIDTAGNRTPVVQPVS